MSARQELLERHARAYAQEGLAVIWTVSLDGDDAKKVTTSGWPMTRPLPNGDGGDYAAGIFANRGQTRNPAITARASGLVLVECDTMEGMAEIAGLALPATWTVQSSAAHKLHFYFRPPPDVEQLPKVAFRFEAGGLTADKERYLVCPPATHPSGAVYTFLPGLGPGDVPIATMPQATYTELLRRAAESDDQLRLHTVEQGAKILAGKRRESVFRHAAMQRRWGLSETAITDACMAFNLEKCEPPLSRAQVAGQVVGAMKYPGGEELTAARQPYAGASLALEETRAIFERHLYLPDPGGLYVVLATVAANLLEGDPLWLLLIAASGGGKTELLNALLGLPGVHVAATITEAALLSGTSKRETASDARGGLLRVIGEQGILVHKDFGSVLSMNRDGRASVLAALREVYDGSWTRHVGTDGGRTLSWSGKLGLVAGATPVIDQHHAVMAALGERFLLYRVDVGDTSRQAEQSLANSGNIRQVRAELREAVNGLFAGLNLATPRSGYDRADVARLVALSTLIVRCRSAVIRDPYSRDVELVPDAEAPGRLVSVLGRLLTALRLIGTGDGDAWRVTIKAALDSMPALRRQTLELLLGHTDPVTTTTVAATVDLPTQTTRRVLQDLTAHGVTSRIPAPEKGKADTWQVTAWARQQHENATVPEKLEEV